MAYLYTVDEAYGGYLSSSYAGYRDAPSTTLTPYVLAEGSFNSAYGALIPGGGLADQDAYSLGQLAPGRYTVRVAGYNWDYSNAIFGGYIAELAIYDASSNLIASSSSGVASFAVYSTSTAIANVVGYAFSGTEYRLYYTYDGPIIVNYPASSGSLSVAGTLRVGSTITATGNFSDANGTSYAAQYFQWFRSADASNWSTIGSATSSSYNLTLADQGYYVGYTISFTDDAGFAEVVSASSLTVVAPPLDVVPGSTASSAVLTTAANTLTSSIDLYGDTDWYGVNLVAGTLYVFDLQGSSAGQGSLVDPWLGLHNSSGGFLVANDDGGQFGIDSRLVYVAPVTGKYYLSAEESGNDATGTYRITMASPATTALQTSGTIAVASIANAGEQDWYYVTLAAGATYQFSLRGAATIDGTLVDPVLGLYGAAGGLISSSDDGGIGKNALIQFTPASSGTYILAATGYGTGTGSYELQVLPNDSAPTSALPQFANNSYIDATTHGYSWVLGPSRTLTWGLADSGAWFWTNPQQSADAISLIFASIEAVANIRFEYAGYFSGASGRTSAGTAGVDIAIAFDSALFSSVNVWGRSNFPSTAAAYNPYLYGAGDILLNPSSAANDLSYAPGSAGYFLILHELGHSLGLKHPHDDGGTAHPTFAQAGIPATFDDDWATVMSYRDDFNWNLTQWDPATPMALDVLALQYLYGANNAGNAGNTSHSLLVNERYQTIWDASGNDTVDASASVYGWNIFLSLDEQNLGLAQRADEAVLNYPTTLYWLMGGIENISGSAQADRIHGNGLANVMLGNGGNDTFEGGAGDDRMEGGGGNDNFDWNAQSEFVASVRAGADTMLGGPGDDIFVVSGADQVIEYASEGVDLIWADGSWSLLNIEYVENLSLYGTVTANLTGGNNSFGNVLTGNSANNLINGGAGNDSMEGGAGDDSFDLDAAMRAGDDTMVGGDGNDTMVVNSAGDVVVEFFLGGIDTVKTTLASFSLAALGNIENLEFIGAGGFGGWGNLAANSLFGNIGNDTLDGGDGDDSLSGLDGNDSLNGASGFDTLYGGPGNDRMNGGNNADRLYGGDGNDSLWGGKSADMLDGGDGDDVLSGQVGNDSLWGGNGIDTADYSASDAVTVDLSLGVGGSTIPIVGFFNGTDSLLGIENVTGSTYADSIVGDLGVNMLSGGDGNDTLSSSDGADTLIGGEGNDMLAGGAGGDSIHGGTGDDVISGGKGGDKIFGEDGEDRINGNLGNDQMTGGGGADMFIFNAALSQTTNVDTILDFLSGTDQIQLSVSIFSAFSGQIGQAPNIGTNLLYDSVSGALSYDPDGAGGAAATIFALIGSVTHPAALVTDFLIVA